MSGPRRDLYSSFRFAKRPDRPAPPADAPLVARDYETFRQLLDYRRMELGLNMLDVDKLAGLSSGYSSKVLSKPRKIGNNYRTVGPDSMGKFLKALGVEIQLVPAIAGSSENASYPQAFLKERARSGALAQRAKMTPKQLREFARKGGLASAAKRRAAAEKRKND